MKPEQVPQEWVLAVANAWPESMLVRRHLAAALAAVAPLIAAAERERCARVADAKEDEYETSYRAGLKSSQHLQGMSDGAGEVAAAIRAMGYRYIAPVTPPATVAALEAERDDWKRLCTIAEPEVAALRQEVQRAGKACFDAQQETVFYRAEVARMKKAASTINEEVCQILGAALGYPWFKDDQSNFPGATDADGVCVGVHVAETLAAEAAKKLTTVAALVEALEGLVMACELPGDHCEVEQALPAARAALAAYREAAR